jgi:hypothetical protein
MAIERGSTKDQLFIKPLRDELMKTFCKKDGSGRVIVLYEAPVHIGDGDICLATVYVYSGASAQPISSMERNAIWDSDWDTDLEAVLVNGDVGYTP